MSSNKLQDIEKEFTFKYITESHYPSVLAFLGKYFYLDEPVNQSLGTSEDRVADLNTRYTDMLNRYQKCMLVTPNFGSDANQVVGVLIINIHDSNNPLPEFSPRSLITTSYLHFLDLAESKYNIFEKHQISTFPELAILSVDKKYRGKGIATELYRRAIPQLFSEGFSLIYTEFSNPISRKIGQTLGFKEVAQVYLKACKNKDGSDLFPKVDQEDFVSLMILENTK